MHIHSQLHHRDSCLITALYQSCSYSAAIRTDKKSCVFSPAGPDGYPGRGGQQCRLALPEATAAQCSAAEGTTQSSASARFPPGMRAKQRELSSSLHRCTDNSGDSSHGDTHVTAVTRGTVQCDRLQTRSPGSVSQTPVEP